MAYTLSHIFFIYLPFALLLGHCTYLYWLVYYSTKLQAFVVPAQFEPSLTFAVIVPVRNEAANIEALLQSLNSQTYPRHLWECIVMDDFSTDGTKAIVESFPANFRLRVIPSNVPPDKVTYKKQSITLGISYTDAHYIVTTDGDCVVTPEWLFTLSSFIKEKNVKMVSAPVGYHLESNFLGRLQRADFSAWVAVGGTTLVGGFPNLCNGANLCYERKAFYEVGGFDNSISLASGDDEFLMHKMAKAFKLGVSFCLSPDVLVLTHSQPTWKALYLQRVRWTSKWRRYSDWRVLLLSGYYVSFYTTQALAVFIVWPLFGFWWAYGIWAIIRLLPEWYFLRQFLKKTHQKSEDLGYLYYAFLVGPYVMFLALAGIKSGYEWKGRAVK